MANVTKPPILDGTGQTIKQKLSEILAALQSSGGSYIPLSQKGAASGVAELDANGKVPSAQLPAYVDDVLEYASLSNFPATGESGKIYIAVDTNKSYRWSGSTYVEISSSLALGETSSTAYRGDRGKTAYDLANTAMQRGKDYVTAGNKSGFTLGTRSTAEGFGNISSNDCSHAEGVNCIASGRFSHAEGSNTIAASDYQHAQGRFNVRDSDGVYAHIVGNGDADSRRVNIHTLDWSGNAWYAGDVEDGSGNVLSEKANTSDIPTKTSDLTNDSGFITDEIVEETDTTDSAPYLHRPTNGTGDRVYVKDLVGGSFGVNQLVADNSKYFINSSVTDTKTILSVLIQPIIAPYSNLFTQKQLDVGTHDIVAKMSASSIGNGLRIKHNGSSQDIELYKNESLNLINNHVYFFHIKVIKSNPRVASGLETDDLNFIDLTLMFGTTIADYVYSLEQATSGNGIAWLKSYGFFTKEYYPYDTGSIQSVKTDGKKYVGKNLFDATDRKGAYSSSFVSSYDDTTNILTISGIWYGTWVFPCEKNTSYTVSRDLISWKVSRNIAIYPGTERGVKQGESLIKTIGTGNTMTFNSGDNDYIAVLVYAGDTNSGTTKQIIQIEKGSTATTYEPYTESTYPISNIELRGIPKLVNNALVYDGDIYKASGDVTRKYGIVDLGDYNWIKDGGTGKFVCSSVADMKNTTGRTMVCSKYVSVENIDGVSSEQPDKSICGITSYYDRIYVKDTSYSDAATFKTAMSGVYLIYELATPTTETTTPYTELQICDAKGTEEFIDDRNVPVPVGHNSEYVDLPNWMEQGYYKDFRDRVDYPQDTGWEKVSIAAAVPSSSTDPYLYYRKRAGMVEVTLPIQAYTTEAGTDVQIATLPQGFRPKIRIASASYENGSDANYLLLMASGEVILHRTASYQGYNMVFFAD